LLNDPKGYSSNKAYLDSCLKNIEGAELGVFRYTFAGYDDYVSKKIYEFENQENSLE